MGLIYLAHDPVIDRKVAIKLIRADLLDGEEHAEYIARFQRETRIAARCAHPNIVAVYDFAVHEGNPFLAMEYVEGPNLSQVLKQKGRLAPSSAVAVMGQVLDALACAHGFGIVHRDVKPANILLLSGERVKMTDFGISHLGVSGLTQAGAVVGTPRYMSPEQCRGDPVDGRSDLFSAGIVLHELLSGAPPFAGRNMTEIVPRIINDPAPDLRTLRPDLADRLVSVVERALAKRPDDRFASAQDMATALRRSLEAGDTDRTVVLAPHQAALTEEMLATAERKLAEYVGPIARILVKRARQAATSPDDFRRRLASHIDSETDRRAFLDTRLS
jgi:serine/threonine-protein kinase